jgi:hypothetical protein
VLLRLGNMRGVDLSIFDFDYDLQWHALMLAPDGTVLGRFGGRDADTVGKYQTLPGLRLSLEAALERFKTHKSSGVRRKPIHAEDYPAAEKLHDSACIHCHHVYEFRRALMQQEKRWSLDDVWVYPQPENIGITLDLERQNQVASVQPRSLAASLGVKAKDEIVRVGATPIASIADVQYALHQAPKKGDAAIMWRSGGVEKKRALNLAEGWRKTDVSWRWSLKSLAPNPSLVGDDLGADERKALGLNPEQLAYRHMTFLTPPARYAGLQANDVIVGVDDQPLAMTARQFETHIRLHYRPGQEITLNVLRGRERMKVKLKLPE